MTTKNTNPELLSTADIAEILGVSRQYVTDHLSKTPKFPLPVVNLSQVLRRWSKTDVMQFLSGRNKR